MPGEKVCRIFSPSIELANFGKAPRGSSTLEPHLDFPPAAYMAHLRGALNKNLLSEANKLSIHIAVVKMLQDDTHPLTREYRNMDNDPHLRLDNWFAKAVEELLSKARAVITTISNSTSKELYSGRFKSSVIIIEEAGCALVVEVLSMVSNYSGSAETFLLVGDPVQLPPCVASLNEYTGPLLSIPFAH